MFVLHHLEVFAIGASLSARRQDFSPWETPIQPSKLNFHFIFYLPPETAFPVDYHSTLRLYHHCMSNLPSWLNLWPVYLCLSALLGCELLKAGALFYLCLPRIWHEEVFNTRGVWRGWLKKCKKTIIHHVPFKHPVGICLYGKRPSFGRKLESTL